MLSLGPPWAKLVGTFHCQCVQSFGTHSLHTVRNFPNKLQDQSVQIYVLIYLCMYVCMCVCVCVCVFVCAHMRLCMCVCTCIYNNNYNNNNTSNNNILIIITFKGANQDFFFTILSVRREPSPTRTLKRPGHNHVQITCNTSSAYHVQHAVLHATWYEGTAQLLTLTELKLHLFERYFVG